jgi:acetyltransferase-like isoleucine patch superfamily enzyme
MSPGLSESSLAPGLLLGDGVEFSPGVTIGAHVVIHADSKIGDGALIQDHVIIGKNPELGIRSSARREALAPAVIGNNAKILAAAVVFAGVTVAADVIVGDQAHLRERSTVGPNTVIGRATAIDNDVSIGARVQIQTNCYITSGTVVQDDVFIGPGVVTTNDNTMLRLVPGTPLEPPRFLRACRIGGGAVICPGVVVGEEAFIAAGAVVTSDVAPKSVVAGVPARRIRGVPPEDAIEHWR